MSDHKTLRQVDHLHLSLPFFNEDNEFSEHEDSFYRFFLTEKENDVGIPNFTEAIPYYEPLYQAGDIYQDENYDCLYPMGLTLGLQEDHEQANSTLEGNSTNSDDSLALHPQLSLSELSSKEPEYPEYLQEKSVTQTQVVKKPEKNQYDKNIAGNICSTVIKKMMNPANEKEIRFYCKKLEVSYRDYTEHFRSILRKEKRFGTSELYNFFSKSEDRGFQIVFGLFLTRFLNEEYLSYILSLGKMSNEKKYVECAINLMYIPKLNIQQTDLISQFHKLV